LTGVFLLVVNITCSVDATKTCINYVEHSRIVKNWIPSSLYEG